MKTDARAFTLLELILATMILGMITLTLYRFVSANLRAIRFSTELGTERDAVQSAVRFIASQLDELPANEIETLSGLPLKFRGLSNDELSWKSAAGAGLMTTAAAGEYRVTLTVQPVSERASETELGLRRQKIDPLLAVESSPPPQRDAGRAAYHWVPLIRPLAALEVRYFDRKLQAWQDTWKDPQRLPSLVRVRLWKRADEAPIEAVLPVPAARLQP